MCTLPRHHTVLIIGGGPAGSAAANTLAKQGIDVGVIDKASFPRDKLCGGLLTLRSLDVYQRIFDQPWDTVISHVAHGIKFIHQTRLINEVSHTAPLFFTRRFDFDHFLIQQAQAHGAMVYQGDAVIAVDLQDKFCRLRSGALINFDFLIGADGVNSLVAKTLFQQSFNPRTVAFALEMEVDRAHFPQPVEVPEIHFGLARWGYGWVFPKRDTLTVGVGGLHCKNPDLKNVFDRFLISRFGCRPQGRIKGHYLPFGDYRKTPGKDNVLLCGDAAGLVEPITGEGIAFAMQSGLYAAEAIIEAQARGGVAISPFQERYQNIARDFNYANRLRYLIFPQITENLFLGALAKSTTLPAKHMDLLSARIQYDEYWRYILMRLRESIIQRIFRRK